MLWALAMIWFPERAAVVANWMQNWRLRDSFFDFDSTIQPGNCLLAGWLMLLTVVPTAAIFLE